MKKLIRPLLKIYIKVGEKNQCMKKYGLGTVIKCDKAGSKVMLMVAFDGEGIKLFDLKKDKTYKEGLNMDKMKNNCWKVKSVGLSILYIGWAYR